jgi:radical SAM superfamily enzyme YgiQ (UPF0313 family)
VAVLLLSTYELERPPLGLAWPAAFLRRAGHAVATADLAVEAFPEDAVRAARVIAIATPMHTALRLGVAAAERVRALNPRAAIVFHGHYAWLNAELLRDRLADAVLAGESEGLLVETVERLLAGERSAAPSRHLGRLDLPPPDRSGLPPLTRYARYVEGGRAHLAAYVEASRGCLHTCRHCPIVPVYGGRFFAVPVETVLLDVRAQVAAGARHVTFGDPDFLNGPTHALRLARALATELPGITFDFTAKVEHLLRHHELLPELRACGCTFVTSALESLSDRVLERLDKGHVAADADVLLGVLDTAGIALRPTFVPFTPWATRADYLQLVEWVLSRGLRAQVPPVQMSIRLLVPPGSALLGLDDAGEWLGELDREAFTHRWRHPDPGMDELQRQVAALAEASSEGGSAEAAAWLQIRDLARAAAGLGRLDEPLPASHRPDPPRLTAHWFC